MQSDHLAGSFIRVGDDLGNLAALFGRMEHSETAATMLGTSRAIAKSQISSPTRTADHLRRVLGAQRFDECVAADGTPTRHVRSARTMALISARPRQAASLVTAAVAPACKPVASNIASGVFR